MHALPLSQAGRGPPLAQAAGNNQMEAVRLLLECGANPNLSDGNGLAPLFYAALQVAQIFSCASKIV
jgi:ankyrin repeat protein